MKYLITLIIIFIEDFLLNVWFARCYAKKCNYNCDNCKAWHCNHGYTGKHKGFYPVMDYYKFCGKRKCEVKND